MNPGASTGLKTYSRKSVVDFNRCEAWHLTWLYRSGIARTTIGSVVALVFAWKWLRTWMRAPAEVVLIPWSGAFIFAGVAMAVLGVSMLSRWHTRKDHKKEYYQTLNHYQEPYDWKVPGDQGAGKDSVEHAIKHGSRMASFLFLVMPAVANGVGFTSAIFQARVPVASGCYTVTDRGLCCRYMDGRPTYDGDFCIPSREGVTFASGHVCEAQCFVEGSCSRVRGYVISDKLVYAEHGNGTAKNESQHAGDCQQITGESNYSQHIRDLFRNSTQDMIRLEWDRAFVTHLEFVGWLVFLFFFIMHLGLYHSREKYDCASHMEELARLLKVLGSLSAAACLGIARHAFHRLLRHRLSGVSWREDLHLMIFSLCMLPIGFHGLQVKVMSVGFVSMVPPTEWSLRQWSAIILFANNMLGMGGNFAALSKPSGLITIESLLRVSCTLRRHRRYVCMQHWLYKFEMTLVEECGKWRAVVIFATLQDHEVRILLNEHLRNDLGDEENSRRTTSWSSL